MYRESSSSEESEEDVPKRYSESETKLVAEYFDANITALTTPSYDTIRPLMEKLKGRTEKSIQDKVRTIIRQKKRALAKTKSH